MELFHSSLNVGEVLYWINTLTVNSGFLKHLKYGDLILADRDFDIRNDLAMVGASLAIQPFIKGKPQLSQ